MRLKKYSLFIIFTIISFNIYSQQIETVKFNSEQLNADRYIKIYIPPSYKLDSTKLYPVAVVLDAEYLFDAYVGNSILFAQKEKAPEQIVVGINQNYYGERYDDCGYSIENSYPNARAEEFYRFIKIELFNYIEENYRTSPFKTIIGNTLTANYINYFLIEDYPSFNAFISISPYLATDMPVLLNNKISTLKNENFYYYMSSNKDNNKERELLIKDSDTILSELSSSKFKYKFDAFKESTRTSAIGQSIPSALELIFKMYANISKDEFEKNVKDLSPPEAIAYLEKKYVEIEYLFGSNLKMREQDIFAIEPIILDKENGDYLKSFGEMINKLFKESAIGDYYIGRYYETGKKYKNALRYYKTGYMKLAKGDPNADGYYENIERVLLKRDGLYIEEEPEN